MQIKQILFLFSLIFIYCFSTQAQVFIRPVKPYSTELISKDEKKREKDLSVLYNYTSQLDKEDILDFYREIFLSEGLEETSVSESVFTFKSLYKYVAIIFVPSLKGKKIDYYLAIIAMNKKAIQEFESNKAYSGRSKFSPTIRVTQPKKINFMPVFPRAKQLEYVNWEKARPPLISIGYLSRRSSAEVIGFYLNKMPSFGWTLTKREPHDGTYSVSEWLPKIAPVSSFCTSCEGSLPAEVPLLKIKGETLTFAKGNKKCILTVHTFADIVKLSVGTVYDLSVVRKNGNTVIGVVYYYK